MQQRHGIILAAIVACSGLSSAAYADDVPVIKPGLWSTTTNLGDPAIPTQKGTMCTSTALLQTLFDGQFKKTNPPCKRSNVVQKGSTITEQHECKFTDDKPVKSTVMTTVTGDSAVHTEVLQEGKKGTIISDSKYVSACPAGMQLGDYVGENGAKFNILHPEDAKAPAKAP
jgi:hypothetical protein